MLKTNLLIFFLMIQAPLAGALVDYTESEETPFSPQQPTRKNSAPSRSVKKMGSSSAASWGDFQLKTNYESISVKNDVADGTVRKINFNMHYQTLYNIFLDVEYWTADTDDSGITGRRSYQQGNPQIIIGFNWLRFGKGTEMATLDLFGGGNFQATNSAFANTRTDKIFGVTTTKRFGDFAIGFGHTISLTSTPKDEEEIAIGNIQHSSAEIGWVVSQDIRFLLAGSIYRISRSNDEIRGNRLQKKLKFGFISPQAILGLSDGLTLVMGAIFRTQRINKGEVMAAKLWNLKGSYGNSLFAGLNISI